MSQALEELKKLVEEQQKTLGSLKERVVKLECDAGVTETGLSAIANALELQGILTNGEPTKPVAKEPKWDPSKITWTTAEGSRGLYERSEDVNSQDFKALLKSLQAHKGKMTKDGYFMWVFTNGHVIGRKRKA